LNTPLNILLNCHGFRFIYFRREFFTLFLLAQNTTPPVEDLWSKLLKTLTQGFKPGKAEFINGERLPYTRYNTVYTTIYDYVTKVVTSKYKLVTELATRHIVSYYDAGGLYTVIAYPTSFIRAVDTVFVGVETQIITSTSGGGSQGSKYAATTTQPAAIAIPTSV
jgi:hypothetical protein